MAKNSCNFVFVKEEEQDFSIFYSIENFEIIYSGESLKTVNCDFSAGTFSTEKGLIKDPLLLSNLTDEDRHSIINMAISFHSNSYTPGKANVLH